jgi:addiction module toxin, relE/stbE family
MTHRIRISPAAARQVRKLDGRTQRRVQAVVELLAQEPRPTGAKKLVGGHGEWRVRTGNYRIIYEIDDGALVVLVLAVGHRREIYRRK